jgi:hypothetical protein
LPRHGRQRLGSLVEAVAASSGREAQDSLIAQWGVTVSDEQAEAIRAECVDNL